MAGRPKKSFSDEEVAELEQLAYEGCQTGTIANIMGIAYKTLVRHFAKNLTKKRCERKQWLRVKQNNLADSNPAMAIFLGKNELGQVDKQTVTTIIEPSKMTDNEKDASAEAAKTYKLRIAREAS